MVGQAGAEYSYDRELRGVDGLLEQNYDATGRAVGPTYVQRAAQPGDTLQLTINSRLQKIAQKAVAYGIQVAHNDGEVTAHTGAIVAMNPQNGQIYAMASYPSYNPSVFLPPAKNAGKLYKDTYNQPLIDKTLEPKAPGSTFKPITATAAWNSGVLGPGTTLDCPGVFYRPGDFSHTPFPNWTTVNLRHHGSADGAGAVVQHLLLPARQQDVRPAQPGHRLPEDDPPVRVRKDAADGPAGIALLLRTGAGSGLAAADLLEADRPGLAAGLRHPDGDRPGRPDRLADAAGGRLQRHRQRRQAGHAAHRQGAAATARAT